MSRGQIPTDKMKSIQERLPDLSDVMRKVRILSPDTISIRTGPKSRIPIAAVCFNDAFSTLEETHYAIRESYAHEVWYREETNPPDQLTSNYFVRFYCDDAALRLYAAIEHLANAILAMVPTNKSILKRYRSKRVNLAAAVRKYLVNHRPNHSVTKSVSKLAQSQDWIQTLDYRGLWVHQQPPLVSGFGMQWKRNVRWQEIIVDGNVTGFRLYGGSGGDKADLTVEELRRRTGSAFALFVQVYDEVLDFYLRLLARKKIRLKGNSLTVKLP